MRHLLRDTHPVRIQGVNSDRMGAPWGAGVSSSYYYYFYYYFYYFYYLTGWVHYGGGCEVSRLPARFRSRGVLLPRAVPGLPTANEL